MKLQTENGKVNDNGVKPYYAYDTAIKRKYRTYKIYRHRKFLKLLLIHQKYFSCQENINSTKDVEVFVSLITTHLDMLEHSQPPEIHKMSYNSVGVIFHRHIHNVPGKGHKPDSHLRNTLYKRVQC